MNDAVWIRGRDSGGDVVVGLDEGDSSRDGDGPVSPPWAVPLWAFTLPIHVPVVVNSSTWVWGQRDLRLNLFSAPVSSLKGGCPLPPPPPFCPTRMPASPGPLFEGNPVSEGTT